MIRFVVLMFLSINLVAGVFQPSGATGPACFNYGKTKDYDRLCIVTKTEGNRMCMVEYFVPNKKRLENEVCEFIRDHGNAGVGDQIIVDAQEFKNDGTGKCYKAPGCGKAIVVGGGASRQSGAASSAPVSATPQRTSRESAALPPPPGSQPPVKDSDFLPPPPLPEGVQGQQQGATTASLPPPPQQPQPQAQPPSQQEPQQPVTQTIDSTLNIFKKARDLLK
jgi:hypothetical protein